jgi:ATP-dependent RNA helicase DHX36
MLGDVSHIILDEIHERDILSDFLIAILKDLLPKRPNLKIILMSATLNAEQFSKYFFNCPMMNIPGFTFPVKEYYLEDVLEMTRFQIPNRTTVSENRPVWQKHTARGKEQRRKECDYEGFIAPYLRDIASSGAYSRQTIESLSSPVAEDLNHELVASLVHHIHTRQREGAILVFLPGWEDISKLNRLFSEGRYALVAGAKVYPLHSLMPTVSQKEIFQKPPSGLRKIVLATNIAETSITIDDVVYVVDCGKIKMNNFDVNANIATLQPEWVSLANAKQRRGRAGRVQPGICYHLYTRAREMTLSQFVVPEMLRTRLEEIILQIKILELGRASSLLSRVMEPPSDRCIELSVDQLISIGALDRGEQLTPLGFHLAQLPMDPHTGKMILLGAIFCCLDPVLSVAASLSFKDAFVVPLGKERAVDERKRGLAAGTKSDHIMLANAISGWERARRSNQSGDYCWSNYLSESTLRMLSNMKDQFAEHLKRLRFVASADCKAPESNRNSGNEDLVRAIICAGLYPNVAKLRVRRTKHRGAFPVLQTLQERRASVHPKSVIANESEFKHPFVAFHQKLKSSSVYVHDCSEMSPISLIFFGREVRVGEEVTRDQRLVETIAVDSFVKLRCAGATGQVFNTLRTHLDQLLEHKISNPGATDWTAHRREGATLNSVVQLLSCSFDGARVEDDDAEDDA